MDKSFNQTKDVKPVNKPVVSSEPPKETYKVFGDQILLNEPEYINYYKTKMKIMKIRYQLVGNINANGYYQISQDVKRDLVNMFKEIEDMGDDWYRASAVYMKKYYFFSVKLQMIDRKQAKASLYINEYVGDFLENEYIITHVADFIDDFDEDFKIKVRQKFNLVDVAMPMSDIQVPNLAVAIQDIFDLELLLGGLYEAAAQAYLERLIKILEKTEKGRLILLKYKELLLNKRKDLVTEKFPIFYKKALLDRVVDSMGGYQVLAKTNPETKEAVQSFNNTIKQLTAAQQKAGGVETIRAEKPQKAAGQKQVKKEEPVKKPKPKEKKPEKKKEEKPKKAAEPKKETAWSSKYWGPEKDKGGSTTSSDKGGDKDASNNKGPQTDVDKDNDDIKVTKETKTTPINYKQDDEQEDEEFDLEELNLEETSDEEEKSDLEPEEVSGDDDLELGEELETVEEIEQQIEISELQEVDSDDLELM